MRPLPRLVTLLLVLGLLGLASVPLIADRFHVQLVTQIMVTAIFALSLDFLVGYTGLVSFGHATYYGLAGYALAILERDLGLTALWLTLPLCLAACALAALLIGWFSLRTSGVFFILITLAFAQMAYYAFNDLRGFGGSDGLYINTKPMLEIGGIGLIDLRSKTEFYYFTLFWLAAGYLVLRMVLRSPFGQVIAAIRANESRARALGFEIFRYKLASFVIAGAVAGLAGYLGAAQFGYVNPAHLAWRESGHVLVIVILGGMGTLFGPVLGAFVMAFLEELVAALTEQWLLVMGSFIIAVVLLLPDGIAGVLLRAAARPTPSAATDEPGEPAVQPDAAPHG